MAEQNNFDILIQSEKELPKIKINNLAELLFNNLPHRNENSTIIISHKKDQLVEIKLQQLRYIIAKLYVEFNKKNIRSGDTVFLNTLYVNAELLTAIMLIALTTYGARVFLPMFVEISELTNWLKITKCKFAILPKKEVNSLGNKYEKEKKLIGEIISNVKDEKIDIFDIDEDFNIYSLINHKIPENITEVKNEIVKKVISDTDLSTESIIFTTSGTTDRSKLVVYDQGGFIKSCYSWQISGLYEYNNIGGKSYVDILPHTVSNRALFNALWTGYPICILTADLILKTPQKVIPLIMKMKPEVITLGPSAIDFILESVILFPEIKYKAFSELRTIVSTGAPYNEKTAETIKKYFGIPLHNAYGTSETQQVLTTILDKNKIDINNISLGTPLAGVTVGLKKYENGMYNLFFKSPFGHKYCIDLDAQGSIYPDEFFNTGDIVKINGDNQIYYIGREGRDFFSNGYGAKIPIYVMKNYYQNLYERSDHIEFYPARSSRITFGVAALIFIEKNNLPKGIVTDKKTVNEYAAYIKESNKTLRKNIVPFEYDQHAIKKFLLINDKAPRTKKKTVSIYKIETNYKNEIDLLKTSYDPKQGIKNVLLFKDTIYNSFLNIFILKNPLIKKLFLKIYATNR